MQTELNKIIQRAKQAVQNGITALESAAHGNPSVKMQVEQLQAAGRQLQELDSPAKAEGPGPDEKGPQGKEGVPAAKKPAKPAPVKNVPDEDENADDAAKPATKAPAKKK